MPYVEKLSGSARSVQNRVIFIDEGQPRNNTNYAFNRGDWFVWGGSASAPQPG